MDALSGSLPWFSDVVADTSMSLFAAVVVRLALFPIDASVFWLVAKIPTPTPIALSENTAMPEPRVRYCTSLVAITSRSLAEVTLTPSPTLARASWSAQDTATEAAILIDPDFLASPPLPPASVAPPVVSKDAPLPPEKSPPKASIEVGDFSPVGWEDPPSKSDFDTPSLLVYLSNAAPAATASASTISLESESARRANAPPLELIERPR